MEKKRKLLENQFSTMLDNWRFNDDLINWKLGDENELIENFYWSFTEYSTIIRKFQFVIEKKTILDISYKTVLQ